MALNHSQSIQYVSNFNELISKTFQGGVNAICWERELQGDFSEIVNSIELNGNMMSVDLEELASLKLTEEGQKARDIIKNDWNKLEALGASPVLNLIKQYEKDDVYPLFSTDVYSYHVDRSPIPVDTFLCTYFGDSSEILPNSQGIQKVQVPEIRNDLLKLYGGKEGKGFESFLKEYFFDLHYQELPNASPISLGIGNLWKIATDHPQSEVLPCLHRAPKEDSGKTRLLLIC